MTIPKRTLSACRAMLTNATSQWFAIFPQRGSTVSIAIFGAGKTKALAGERAVENTHRMKNKKLASAPYLPMSCVGGLFALITHLYVRPVHPRHYPARNVWQRTGSSPTGDHRRVRSIKAREKDKLDVRTDLFWFGAVLSCDADRVGNGQRCAGRSHQENRNPFCSSADTSPLCLMEVRFHGICQCLIHAIEEKVLHCPLAVHYGFLAVPYNDFERHPRLVSS
jgi:hypothetical protein